MRTDSTPVFQRLQSTYKLSVFKAIGFLEIAEVTVDEWNCVETESWFDDGTHVLSAHVFSKSPWLKLCAL